MMYRILNRCSVFKPKQPRFPRTGCTDDYIDFVMFAVRRLDTSLCNSLDWARDEVNLRLCQRHSLMLDCATNVIFTERLQVTRPRCKSSTRHTEVGNH